MSSTGLLPVWFNGPLAGRGIGYTDAKPRSCQRRPHGRGTRDRPRLAGLCLACANCGSPFRRSMMRSEPPSVLWWAASSHIRTPAPSPAGYRRPDRAERVITNKRPISMNPRVPPNTWTISRASIRIWWARRCQNVTDAGECVTQRWLELAAAARRPDSATRRFVPDNPGSVTIRMRSGRDHWKLPGNVARAMRLPLTVWRAAAASRRTVS